MAGARPGGVTLVAIIVWIQGALNIVSGIIGLFNLNSAAYIAQFGGRTQAVTATIVVLVFGLIAVAVAGGLLRGSRVSRAVVSIVLLLSLITDVWALFAVPSALFSAIVGGFLALIALVLLWSGRARAFFRGA